MTRLSYCPETVDADWLVRSETPAMHLINFGPSVFEAYARLRFISDLDRAGQNEAHVDLPDDHLSGLEQTRLALRRLSRFTSTPDE